MLGDTKQTLMIAKGFYSDEVRRFAIFLSDQDFGLRRYGKIDWNRVGRGRYIAMVNALNQAPDLIEGLAILQN